MPRRPKAAADADLERARRRLEAALADLVDVNAELSDALARYSARSARLAELVVAGEPLVGALEAVGGASVRSDVNVVAERQVAARHEVRVAMCVLALAQGHNLSELARALGISRQLASRLAAEGLGGPAAGGDPRPSPSTA